VICDLNAPPPIAVSEFERMTGTLILARADTTNPESLKKIFQKHGIDRVIHTAAITAGPERDAREPRRIAEVNLIGTLNVLEAARDHSVRRLVHASTGALFGAAGQNVGEPLDEERHRPVPESMYGITKYAAERSVLRLGQLWGLDAVVGRLAHVYGRWEYDSGLRDTISLPTRLARVALAGGEAVFPKLGIADYIYAPDVARALVALLDAPAPKHRLYHLGTGAPWALPQWCEQLAQRFPAFRWRESEKPDECNVRPRSFGTRTPFSNRRLVEDLGYVPRYDVKAAAEDFVSWLRAHESLQ
jgi:nucleoside-diphosphate-sugar epimerase